MDDFDPMRYGFQDCTFLDMDDPLAMTTNSKAHVSDYSSNSSMTPSPQEILSANFNDDWNDGQQVLGIDNQVPPAAAAPVTRPSRLSEMSSPGKYSSCTSDSDPNHHSPLFVGPYDNGNYVIMSQPGGPLPAMAHSGGAGGRTNGSVAGSDSSAPPTSSYPSGAQWFEPSSAFSSPTQGQHDSNIKQEPISPGTYDLSGAELQLPYDERKTQDGFDGVTSTLSNTSSQSTAVNTASSLSTSPPPESKPTRAKSRVTKIRKEKASHNMIEKRYRTNINQKILALRNCVPSLRCVVAANGCEQQPTNEDLEGLTPASKLNKATVLTKATEYIMHLQSRNAMLLEEIAELRRAVNAGSAAPAVGQMPQGAINMQGAPSMVADHNVYNRTTPRQNMVPKAMMYTMAGLMTASSMVGGGIPGQDDTRALYALPAPALTLISHLRTLCIFITLLYIVSPLFGWFNRSKKPQDSGKVAAASADSIYKRAWLTALTSLRLPSADASAIQALCYLGLVCMELAVSFFVGLDGYKFFTKMMGHLTLQDSFALRAIDAQLSGGDDECTRLRMLTLYLRSYLIAPSAKRYLLQSIQLRVLFDQSQWIVQHLAQRVSQAQWKRAANCLTKDESLHLAKLLEQDYFDVLSHKTIDCIRDLAFHQTSTTSSEGDELLASTSMSVVDRVCYIYAMEKLKTYIVNGLQKRKIESHDLKTIMSLCPEGESRLQTAIVKSIFVGGQRLDSTTLAEVDLNNCSQATRLGVVCANIMSASDASEISSLVSKDLTPVVSKLRGEQLGVLAFASLYRAMLKVQHMGLLKGDNDAERAAALARVWIGSEGAESAGLGLLTRRKLVGKCVLMSVHFGGMDLDEGYCSY